MGVIINAMELNLKSRQEATFELGKFLDESFLLALKRLPMFSDECRENSGISMESLISGLFIIYGDRILVYFEPSMCVTSMVHHYFPDLQRGVGPNLLAREIPAAMHKRILPWEPSLMDLLWKAARISLALGLNKVTLETFVSALAIDNEYLLALREKRGIRLKGYLEPLEKR
jgi:hypothetical protein